MIAADAYTIPWLWRGCAHVYDIDAAYPRRCLGCRAIDHGAGPAPRHANYTHLNGFPVGVYPYPMTEADTPKVTITRCDKGHEMVRTRFVRADHEVSRYTCHVCREERRQAKLLEPCDAGHVGSRYYTGLTSIRGIRCRECESRSRMERKRRARAVSITRAYAEAANV